MRVLLMLIIIGFMLLNSCTQDKISNYDQLNRRILNGWNTWDNRSILTHVLLPDGLALTVQVHDTLKGDSLKFAFTGNTVKGAEHVRPLAHTPDGSYTDFIMHWRDFGMRVQSVAKGDELAILVTPIDTCKNPGFIKLAAEMLYNRSGEIIPQNDRILVKLADKSITARPITPDKSNLKQFLKEPIAYSTVANVQISEIQQWIRQEEEKYIQEKSKYGELGETWNAIQNAVNWLVVYDPEKDRGTMPKIAQD